MFNRGRQNLSKYGGAENESKDHTGLYGVQAAQLQHGQKQEERPRQT